MKKLIYVLIATTVSISSYGQKNAVSDSPDKSKEVIQKKLSCDSIVVDFETGMINGKLNPGSPTDSIKKYLPCVSSEFAFGSEDRVCGGGAFLEKPGIYFNTEHGFVEFSAASTVHFPTQIFGVAEDDLPTVAGDPSQITDLQPYADKPIQSVYLYPKSYGCVAIWVDEKDKKAFKVQLHNQPPDKVFLCVE